MYVFNLCVVQAHFSCSGDGTSRAGKDRAFTMFPRIDRQMIWRDIVPVAALVLALVLMFWTRDDASAQYSDIQLDSCYQDELHAAN
jgi:hypothetical protein